MIFVNFDLHFIYKYNRAWLVLNEGNCAPIMFEWNARLNKYKVNNRFVRKLCYRMPQNDKDENMKTMFVDTLFKHDNWTPNVESLLACTHLRLVHVQMISFSPIFLSITKKKTKKKDPAICSGLPL